MYFIFIFVISLEVKVVLALRKQVAFSNEVNLSEDEGCFHNESVHGKSKTNDSLRHSDSLQPSFISCGD